MSLPTFSSTSPPRIPTITIAAGLNRGPSYYTTREDSLEEALGWSIGSEVVSREMGVLVGDVARVVQRIMDSEDIEASALMCEMYNRER
jgi:hypothetical protein